MKFSTVSALFLAAAVPALGWKVPCKTPNPNYMFVFGDSYTTVGFNISLSWPSTKNPIGNPAFPGETTTGGPNWIGYLTASLNKTLIYTYDFAVSHATTNNSITISTHPMQSQIETEFLPALGKHPAAAPWKSHNSYFMIFIGINDIGGLYATPYADYNAMSKELQTSYMKLMGELYAVGARNFLFMNIPPTQHSPMIAERGPTAQMQYGAFVDAYNAALPARIKQFQATHDGVKTRTFDNHAFWVKVLASPTKYGFKDNSSIDASGAAPYLWSDNYHPGWAFNKILAKEVARELREGKPSWW